MQPLQYDLRSPAAKDNSITNAATARSNPDAAITMRSAETAVAKHNRTTHNGVGNCSSKTGSRRQSEKKYDFEALFKRIFRRKFTSAKMKKICWQITVAAFMQPLQYDLRSPAAKDNSITNAATARSNLDATIYTAGTMPLQDDWRYPAAKDNGITHAATARSNLDAAITMRSAETELQNAIELRATASEIVAPKPDLDARAKKKTILKHFLKWFLEENHWRQNRDNLLTNHCGSLHAATPIRFTKSSCKRQ